MSITNVSAARFLNLKARMKEVFKKRKYYGDLSIFATDDFDFMVEPKSGDIILSDHGVKVINLILSVNDIEGIKKIENDNYILRDITAIENMVTKLESQTSQSSSNLCRGGCMGICVEHCSTGCSGSCKDNCSSSQCSINCTGACVQECSSCSGTCSGTGCRSDCKNDCIGGSKAYSRG